MKAEAEKVQSALNTKAPVEMEENKKKGKGFVIRIGKKEKKGKSLEEDFKSKSIQSTRTRSDSEPEMPQYDVQPLPTGNHLNKVKNLLGVDVDALSSRKSNCRQISPSAAANRVFSKTREYKAILSSIRDHVGTPRVAEAELRFYMNMEHDEYQDSPVDIFQGESTIDVLLLRQSHSKRTNKPKWKPLLFHLAPGCRLGIAGVYRTRLDSGVGMYKVHFIRNPEGFPLNFAKHVLGINNWSTNTLYNTFKKIALQNSIKHMIKARTGVAAAILNGEVYLIPRTKKDDWKMHCMFTTVFGKDNYAFDHKVSEESASNDNSEANK
eukprot:CAMPEP_0114527884 /NCGR_PEP_ID=MMETSP0109-20121206/23880_1 /TAXON_ID=29199 /ORGANISM="Chlorarachnion reptans, Strain CCCM449" /LENGTH=322 /DNA_ID=CAMNT_0001709931 /DNA_START=518 /DNA_END=1486 /DNA_ORIENTATION=+